MNELKFIPIKDITMLSNYRDVQPVSEKDVDIQELSLSISKDGVLQPILVRPNKKPGHYELIFGHRRLVACKLAKVETIPANVKDVKDEDILEYQVTENLQRKDVHPMDESIAFKSLIDKKGFSIEEIAARFGKGKDYVTKRLKLIDLVDPAQKLFKQNKMMLGHALELSRLQSVDQVEVLKHFRNDFIGASVNDVWNYISGYIMMNLDKAPWKKDDHNLVPAAGACNVCPKRSGKENLLFSDIKENNRCFDKQCFLSKSERFLYEKAKELMETRPDVVLVCRDPADVPKDIRELAKSLEVKILKEDTDYETYHSTYGEIKFTIKKRGFFLDGYRKGQYDEVYLASGKGKLGGGSSAATKEKEKSGKLTASDIDDEIKRIQDREKRSKEIDVEKIHKATLEHIDKIKELKQPGMKWQPIDRGIMVFLLMESGGFRIDDELKKIKGLPAEPRERHKYYPEFFKALSAISDDNLAFLVRRLALEKYGNKNLVNGISTEDTTMRLIAEYAGIALPVIEKTQKQTAEARVSRIEVRISELRDKKKLLNQRPKKKAK